MPGKYGDVRFLVSVTVSEIKRLGVELLMKRSVRGTSGLRESQFLSV